MPAKQIRANIPSSGQRFLIHWAYLFVHVNAATYVVLLGTLREGTEAQGSLGNLICWVISRLSFVLVPWIQDQRRMAWTYVQHDILNIPAVNKSWCLPLSQLKVKVNVQFLCIILVWCLRLEDSWEDSWRTFNSLSGSPDSSHLLLVHRKLLPGLLGT